MPRSTKSGVHTHTGITVGKRMTKARREIIGLLERTSKPLTIQTIASKVEANEASVYRTIKLLYNEHVIEEIAYPDGTRRYALGGHHHHIICVRCGHTVHIPCVPLASHSRLTHPEFGTIDHHEVTYYGDCTACA